MTKASPKRVASRKSGGDPLRPVLNATDRRELEDYAAAFRAQTSNSLILAPIKYDWMADNGVDMANFARTELIPTQ